MVVYHVIDDRYDSHALAGKGVAPDAILFQLLHLLGFV